MAISDEQVITFAAVRDLALLGEAYRATSRAHLLIISRQAQALTVDEDLPAEERARAQRLERRAGTARETDAAFAVRGAQLRRRMLELCGLEDPE